MSLDVYLHESDLHPRKGSGIFIRRHGALVQISREEWDAEFPGREPIVFEQEGVTDEVYWRNITHNLGEMAAAAGLYDYLWRPEENGIALAKELVLPLRLGLARLLENPGKYKAMNPENGWGDYGQLVEFVDDYISACERYPDAKVKVSR